MRALLKRAKADDQLEKFKSKLKQGDVLLSVPHKRDLVRRAAVETPQGTQFAHATIYDGGGQIIEISRTRGAHKKQLDTFLEENHAVAMRPQVSQREKNEAIERARSLVGSPYSISRGAKSILGFESEADEDNIEEVAQNQGVICSSVAGYAYKDMNFQKSPLNVLPKDILQHPKFKRIGQSFEPDNKPSYQQDLTSMGVSLK
ncbi:MAG: hypothetical protein ABEN55_11285 [Bradymonadaceae bacterium]